MKRRDFLRGGVAGAACAVAAGLSVKASGAPATPPRTRGDGPPALPTIRLGTLEVSRFILGSNPFWGYSHKSAALDEEMKRYHTDERIMQILDEAAECGVTAVASPPQERWTNFYPKYLEKGGRLRIWISQCDRAPEFMLTDIDRSVKAGAKALFIQGARVEDQYAAGKFDVLRSWLERVKEAGLPAGCAAHWPEVHPELERRKLPTDFYYQCFYNASKSSNYAASEREKAVATLLQIDKPVVAYKILAAGRLAPSEGFEYAFNHIRRKDGVCVGIYAQNAVDQIRQNATYTSLLSA